MNSVPSETMGRRWNSDFKHSHTDTNYAERADWPNSAAVPENTKKLYKVVLVDCKLKLHEIEEELKTPEGSVLTISHEHLSMRKLCSKRVWCLICFCTHPILQIWPTATTGCLQTSKECSREKDLAPMKKWFRKLRCILRPKTDCSTKKHWIVREALESEYHPRRGLLMNKVEFCLKVVLLVRPGTYWVMCYLCMLKKSSCNL